ncbi:acyl-CoA reductase [Desertivirga brevis]|uniref:acyl-CoA reductase n=1 Tax=Desertivirga brevis TaxID=2810310 RepID=UPI001A968037|nr:acyl-CoA reductase [Pedobacter sp. SYSU D00873]
MTLQQRKRALKSLGEYLLSPDKNLNQIIHSAHFSNGWFAPSETERAVRAWGTALNEEDLQFWLGDDETSSSESRKVGLVLAGNIPLVGFHDIITVLAAGHVAMIKLSSQDKVLIPHVLQKLIDLEPGFQKQIEYVDRLENFDAVIATGSNNTARYFEYYFKMVPNIIRKNRNSVAILCGTESSDDLSKLGEDIFNYYGLGCRNVSKLFVPESYNFDQFFEAIEPFKTVGDNHKYNNNYDYNKSVFLVNLYEHLDNGFLLLKEDTNIASPLGVLFFQRYKDLGEVTGSLNAMAQDIQVVVSGQQLNLQIPSVGFGKSQSPNLWDYADGVNTLDFLRKL